MSSQESKPGPITILRVGLHTLLSNKIVLFPFCIIAFIELLVLEILYFAPQYPLNVFFGPIIQKIWSESFLHYPLNFMLLPKLFQYAQYFIYIFLSGYFIAVAVSLISNINNERTPKVSRSMKEMLGRYVHVVIAAFLIFALMMGFFRIYGMAIERAMQIRSEAGIFYILKRVVIDGAPYFNLLASILIMSFFAYVIPIIVIERKKIFSAIILNVKMFFRNFGSTLGVILLPSLFFIPVLLLRRSIPLDVQWPEIRLVILVISIVVTLIIDALIYTSLTTLYLYRKEDL